ncbi:hypothetical protein ACHAWF_016712 [Thalassiosira exigua]
MSPPFAVASLARRCVVVCGEGARLRGTSGFDAPHSHSYGAAPHVCIVVATITSGESGTPFRPPILDSASRR